MGHPAPSGAPKHPPSGQFAPLPDRNRLRRLGLVSEGVAGAAATALVGRTAEFSRAAEMVSSLAAGHGGLLLIRGEAGIGKTALLREFTRNAALRGIRVAEGAAEELEQGLPFAAITACLGAAASPSGHETSQIWDMLHGTDRRADVSSFNDTEYLVAEAILGLIDRWCAIGPVLLAIDDLQWADRASLLVLHRLGFASSMLPLLIMASCRPQATRDDLDGLIRSWSNRHLAVMTLRPLSPAAVALLIAQVTGKPPTSRLLGLVSGAGGNPLYVSGLTQALRDAGQIILADDAADGRPQASNALPLPRSLIDTVTHRLGSLSPSARQVLPCAAILGPRFTAAELAATLGTPAFELLGVIQELIEAGVFTTDHDRLVFGHDVIREAIYESVPASARQALHTEAAHALAVAGTPTERVAHHLLAGDALDGQAVAWTVEAADRLIVRTPGQAVELFRRAFDTVDLSQQQASRLYAAMATALLTTRQFVKVRKTARRALANPLQPRDEAAIRWALVHSLLNQGHAEAALDEAQGALASDNLILAEQARFHGIAAQCLHIVSSEGPAAAMASATRARDMGLASRDARAAAYGLQAVAGALRWDGRFAEALEEAEQAEEYLQDAEFVADAHLLPGLISANCLVELDRDHDAARIYADDIAMAERGTGSFFLAFIHLSVARMHFLRGDWDNALTEINAARDVPDNLGLSPHLNGLAALISAHRGDTAAIHQLAPSLPNPLTTGTTRHTFDDRAWGFSAAALAMGNSMEAYHVLQDAWTDCIKGQRAFCAHYLLPEMVDLGMSHSYQGAVDDAVAAFEQYITDRAAPAMHRSAAFSAAIRDHDAKQLLCVADEYATAVRPLLEAQVREHAADELAADGAGHAAREQLDLAARLYASLDATWDIARAESRLRRHGIRRGVRGHRRRPKSGWAALTPTEEQIARLVSAGLSNPDIAARTFTSRRTVQFHVSSILTKLDLVSRVEIAAAVARRETNERRGQGSAGT